MADIQSQLPVKLTDNTNTAGITAGGALKTDGSAVTQPVSGTITTTPTGTYTVVGTTTAVPSGTQVVSGTVTSTPTGTYTVTASSMTVVQATAANLKATVVGNGTAGTADAGVITIQGIASMTAVKVDGSAVTQPVSGTIVSTPTGTYTVAGTVTSVPSGTQPVSGTVTATPTGTYTVTSTLMSVTGTGTTASPAAGILTVQGNASGVAIPVSGTVVSTPTGTYTVAGTVTSVPSGTQAVSGTVTATPTGTYTVAGTVTSVPSGTQAVSGTVTATPTGTYTVAGTTTVVQSNAANLKATVIGNGTAGTADAGVLTVQGINSGVPLNVSQISQSGIVVNYQTQASLANASTATLSYTVTTGKTLYLKGVFASSSGAPCKVVVDYGAGPTVVGVGFYSTSAPFLAMNFIQPPSISATTVVNIKIQNNAGSAQDVYCTLMGEER